MRAHRPQGGFTYLGLLAAVVIIGIMLSMASRVWLFTAQRDREQQLLYVGEQYRTAIARYFAFGHQYPVALENLLADQRFPVARRHLRQLYPDPMTGSPDWQLIKDPTGVGIMGIASQSKLAPIKRAGFTDDQAGFAKSDCYCSWQFVYIPPTQTHRYSAPPRQP